MKINITKTKVCDCCNRTTEDYDLNKEPVYALTGISSSKELRLCKYCMQDLKEALEHD